MADIFDDIRGLVDSAGELFELGYETLTGFFGDDAEETPQSTSTVASKFFDSFQAKQASRKAKPAKTKTSKADLAQGLISTSPARAERTGETTPVGFVDARQIQAMWLVTLDTVGQITNRTRGAS